MLFINSNETVMLALNARRKFTRLYKSLPEETREKFERSKKLGESLLDDFCMILTGEDVPKNDKNELTLKIFIETNEKFEDEWRMAAMAYYEKEDGTVRGEKAARTEDENLFLMCFFNTDEYGRIHSDFYEEWELDVMDERNRERYLEDLKEDFEGYLPNQNDLKELRIKEIKESIGKWAKKIGL